MISSFRSSVLLLFAAVTVISCEGGIFMKNITEGTIEYKAVPVRKTNTSPMLLPDKMVVKFKDNFHAAELEAGMGFAKMKFISDPLKKQFITQVNLLDKFTSTLDQKALDTVCYYYPEYTVEESGETKDIAGYNCKKATLKFTDGSDPVEVWYTKDIGIKTPNWSNTYYKIDGVLMEYSLRKFGLELRFTATSVTEGTIAPEYFTVPAEYKKIENAELEKMFEGFF
jgi:hypothetical protein